MVTLMKIPPNVSSNHPDKDKPPMSLWHVTLSKEEVLGPKVKDLLERSEGQREVLPGAPSPLRCCPCVHHALGIQAEASRWRLGHAGAPEKSGRRCRVRVPFVGPPARCPLTDSFFGEGSPT